VNNFQNAKIVKKYIFEKGKNNIASQAAYRKTILYACLKKNIPDKVCALSGTEIEK